MYEIGNYIRWETASNGEKIKKVGIVIAVVPPFANPHDYVPVGYSFNSTAEPRKEQSYLIRVPGYNNLYWPYTSLIELVPPEDVSELFSNDNTARKLKVVAGKIDRYDREALKGICKIMKLIWGDQVYEGKNFMTFPQWGYRFWFDIKGGIEYIKEVEKFKPVKE